MGFAEMDPDSEISLALKDNAEIVSFDLFSYDEASNRHY